MYLATVPGCCTKKAVGYAMADNMRTDLICEAIDMAARRCPYTIGETILLPRAGAASTPPSSSATTWRATALALRRAGPGCAGRVPGRKSAGATLKNERVYQMVYPTISKAVRDIASWIELEYNQKRLHSALGYRTPNEVEEEHRAVRQAA